MKESKQSGLWENAVETKKRTVVAVAVAAGVVDVEGIAKRDNVASAVGDAAVIDEGMMIEVADAVVAGKPTIVLGGIAQNEAVLPELECCCVQTAAPAARSAAVLAVNDTVAESQQSQKAQNRKSDGSIALWHGPVPE